MSPKLDVTMGVVSAHKEVLALPALAFSCT